MLRVGGMRCRDVQLLLCSLRRPLIESAEWLIRVVSLLLDIAL